jgi:hypothetical protein
MIHNTFATILIPIVFGTPFSYIHFFLEISTRAKITIPSRAVATTKITSYAENKNEES